MKTNVIACVLMGLLAPSIARSQGTLYLSNIGNPTSGNLSVASDASLAAIFHTGNSSGGYDLTSIQLLMGTVSGNPNGFSVSIWSNLNGVPGYNLGYFAGSNPSQGGTYSYASPGIQLLAGNSYFLVANAAAPSAQGAYSWSVAGVPTYSSSGGWLIGAGYESSSDGMNWQFTRDTYLQFDIYATPIPEPSTAALGTVAALALGLNRWRKFSR